MKFQLFCALQELFYLIIFCDKGFVLLFLLKRRDAFVYTEFQYRRAALERNIYLKWILKICTLIYKLKPTRFFINSINM